MDFDIRRVDLGKLNSMTKYPSILTYHVLGDKGILQETVQIPFEGRVIGSEKVDGTNCRLVFCPDESVIVGSREDLLWERRDLIGNPAMGIVEAVKDAVHRLFQTLCRQDRITVYFVEVYGRNIGGGARNYSKEGNVGFRLFDVVFQWPSDRIANWRDQGGQRYAPADQLVRIADEIGFQSVPVLFDHESSTIPSSLEETYQFLLGYSQSRCKLDESGDGAAEGIVVRTPDRARIAKIRREDYQRTLKRRHGKK